MSKVLIVDDKPMMRDSVATTLLRAGHMPIAADSGERALELTASRSPDVVISDLKMPGMDGIALLQAIRELRPSPPTILMTAFASVDTAVRALKLGAFDYLRKPFEPQELVAIVERAAGTRAAARGQPMKPAKENLLIGDSTVMRELRDQIATVAAAQGTVLITGESGTGKELAAGAVHAMSGRAHKPMVCLNCAAISEGLLESELFGHEKGAFTGADQSRQGRFELADGATLLLDEVSEISPRLQAKLLRVLQEWTFERVGSAATLRVDVRVIATSNRDLQAMVRRGEFRHDLYFRLNVLPIRMPPLRERIMDVVPLARHFVARHSRAIHFADDALGLLRRYPWPGNVRELENLCERAAVMNTSDVIGAEAIGPWLAAGLAQTVEQSSTLDELERQTIVTTLARYNGHRERTAAALGIAVRTLGLKIKRWKEQNLVAGSL